jgi:integrase
MPHVRCRKLAKIKAKPASLGILRDSAFCLKCRIRHFRHRFAAMRLAAWHREKIDVQALLPLLATYLGHARYSDTAYYVTGTAELLGMAADRAFADGGVS